MEEEGEVPETYEGSVKCGEGFCSGMGSRLEKPSSSLGQPCPQRPGSRGPSHCLPASFILESVQI